MHVHVRVYVRVYACTHSAYPQLQYPHALSRCTISVYARAFGACMRLREHMNAIGTRIDVLDAYVVL